MVFLRDNCGKYGNTANKGMFDLKIAVFLVFLVFLFAIPAQGRYSGGNGEPNTPYLIGTAEDLNDIANHPNDFSACFVMVNDINMADYTYSVAPIAPEMDSTSWEFDGPPFTGVFDGNDCKIMNLTINANDAVNRYLGLFGLIGLDGEVKNLGIESCSITVWNYCCDIGVLCGENYGTISNCYTTGDVAGGDGYSSSFGGLCGSNYYGTISNCYAAVNVTGGVNIGGLCGYNDEGAISNCFWDTQTSGVSTSSGGTGLHTTEMQTESTFTDAGWDFVAETINGLNDIWDICEGTNYPRLVWSIPQADLLCPDGVDFIDYSYFANCWDVNDPNCDFDESGCIDANDLILFGDDWLRKY